jgi:hypothetical protein
MVFADGSPTEKATTEKATTEKATEKKGFYILRIVLSFAGFDYDASSWNVYIFALLPCYILYKEEDGLCTDTPALFHTSAPANTLS